jgi:hypothetical protein
VSAAHGQVSSVLEIPAEKDAFTAFLALIAMFNEAGPY